MFFKPLSFGVIYYASMATYYHNQSSLIIFCGDRYIKY